MTNIFKRSTAFIAMLALLLSLFGVAAFADGTPTFTVAPVSESVDVTDGDTELVLAIGIENNPGIAAINLTLNIPDDWVINSDDYPVLTYNGSNAITRGQGFNFTINASTHYLVGAATNNLTTESGVICWVGVTVPQGTDVGSAAISLTVNSVKAVNENGTVSDVDVDLTSSFTEETSCTVEVVDNSSGGSSSGGSSSGDTSDSGDEGGDQTYTGGTVTVGTASIDVSEADSVVVPISITGNPGFAGLTVSVSVPTGFTADAALIYGSDFAVTADMTYVVNYVEDESCEMLVFSSTKNVADDGVLAWLTLTATDEAANGEYTLTVSVDEAVDASDVETNLASYYTVESGTLTVSGVAEATPTSGTVSVGSVSASVADSDTVLVPVSIADNEGFAGMTLTVSVPEGWKTSNVYFVNGDDYAVTAEMTSAFSINAKTNADVTVTFASAENMTDDGVLCWIEYVIPSNASSGTSDVSVTVTEAYTAEALTNNWAGNFTTVSGTITLTAPTITVGSSTVNLADNEDVVLVPVSIKNNVGFAGMTLTVTVPEGWKTSNVYFVNGDDYAVTADMTSAFSINAKTNADVTVTFASSANVTEDGVLCWIEYVVPAAVGEYEVTAAVSELYTADALTNNLAGSCESVAGTLTVVQPVVSAGSVAADNNVGTCVLVPISIADNAGFAGMTLTVSVPDDWTTTNVYFVNGDDYAITADMTSAFQISAKNNNDVTVTFASADNVTGDGVLCWVEYTWTGSVDEGEYDVSVTVDEAYAEDDLATNLASYYATEDGTITVSTFGIALDYSGEATVGAGDTVTLTARVTGSGDYASTVFALTYDSSLFTFVSAEGAESVDTETAGVVSFTMSEAGDVTFSFTANSVTGVKTGTFSLSYSYTGSGSVSPSVSDAVTVAIAPVVSAGSVAADNNVGTCVLVPISIADNAGFAGMTLTVSVPDDWTTTNVYFVNGDDYAITADMTSAFQISAKNNNDVTVTFASADNVTGDGVLCWVEYTWTGSVDEGEYDVSVTVDEAYAADDLATNLASYYATEGGTITVSSYGYSISVDADSVTAGDTVTVTLTVTGDNTEDAVFYVTYSSDLFTFVSADGATAADGDGAVALTLTEAGTVTLTFTVNDCEESATGEFSTYYIYSGATESSAAQSVKVSYVKYYTVTLQTSSGSEIASCSVSAGSTVGSVLTEDDLSAGDSAGWIISGGDGTKYTSEEVLAMTVTDDITFRVYKKSSSSGGSSSGSSSSSTNTDSTGTVDTTDTTMNTTPIEIAATEVMTAEEAAEAVAAMTDVDPTAYYYDATLWAVQNGIVNGTSDVTFDPEIGCTRAMIVTLLYRLAGSPEINITDTGFIDVSENAYYYDAVLWAVENGITNGVGDDMFAPDLICTREQIVTLMYRFVGQPETDAELVFTDVNPDYYSTNAIIWAYANGITDGIGDNQFGPTLDCTRAQVVTFLYRFAQL